VTYAFLVEHAPSDARDEIDRLLLDDVPGAPASVPVIDEARERAAQKQAMEWFSLPTLG
jgi:hypothetical protein